MSLAVVSDTAPSAPRPIHVRPWEDPVLDHQGHDPRSAYAETFWLPLLGPSATFLARRIAAGLERSPGGFLLATDDAARSLGLGAKGGRRSPFNRTLGRLAQFRMLYVEGDDVVLARRKLPGLTRTQVGRLPAPLREAHQAYKWAEQQAPALPVMRERARVLAVTLLQVGETAAEVDAHLRRLRFHPSLCHESVHWALHHLGLTAEEQERSE